MNAHTAIWRPAEIRLQASLPVQRHYDREVTARFRGPDGETIERPAFWCGGDDWRVRFAPTAVGEWTYTVSSSPADPGLDAVTGTVVASEPASDASPVFVHGFLRASSDGTHLEHRDGTPFFWLADTHWRFAAEEWDRSNKPGWESRFRGTVDLRAEQGFSVYQSNLLGFDGLADAPHWGGGVPFRDIGFEYFDVELDRKFAYLADAGLVHALGFGWHEMIDDDPEGFALFARYLVARYGAHPMVWTLGGEVPGYDPARKDARLDGWRQVALATQKADGYQHPHTVHLVNERPVASYYQGEDWLTFTLHQHGHGDLDLRPTHYLDHLERYPGVPLIEGETLYEGLNSVEHTGRRPVSDVMVRQAAYRAIQAGCCGYSYGAQGCWNGAWDEDDLSTPWGSLAWYDGVELPGATQLGHMRRAYESIAWETLRPAPEALDSSGSINAVYNAPVVSADADRTLVVAYLGETFYSAPGAAALVGLTQASYDLRWFDTRSGEFIEAGAEDGRVVNGRIDIPVTPQSGKDWLLIASASN